MINYLSELLIINLQTVLIFYGALFIAEMLIRIKCKQKNILATNCLIKSIIVTLNVMLLLFILLNKDSITPQNLFVAPILLTQILTQVREITHELLDHADKIKEINSRTSL